MIHLHFWPTPNGKKVTIQLEESAIPYELVPCNIGRADQFKDDFLNISPNNRMPAMIDDEPLDHGEPVSIFESGAIMLYLAEKSGKFMPRSTRGRYDVVQWVMWQMANQGPKTGEAGHFRRMKDKEQRAYGVRRFTNEVNRLYGVLNNQLYDQPYVCGDEYTIADMICYPWIVGWKGQGQNLDDFKYVKRWFEELSERPGVKRGMAAGEDLPTDAEPLDEETRRELQARLYNQKARPAPEEGGYQPQAN